VKKKFPNIAVVYGGVHATFLPEESFVDGRADFVLVGEAEISLPQLVGKLNVGDNNYSDIFGIVYKKEGKIVNTGPAKIIYNLEDVPLPDYDLIDFKDYNTTIHDLDESEPAVHIMTSRGCPGNCTYCASPALYGRRVRFRSPENIVAEIELLVNRYGVRKIHFHDDNFVLLPDRLKKMCELLIEKKLGVAWVALARVDTIVKHAEILGIMKKAGCNSLEIGVESSDASVLSELNKGTGMTDIKMANKLIKEAGIKPHYLMMCFTPGETVDTPYNSAKMLYELKYGDVDSEVLPVHSFETEEVMSHLMRVSPGCDLWKHRDEKGMNLATIWEDHYEERHNFIPFTMLNDVPMRTGLFDAPFKTLLDYKPLIDYYRMSVFYCSVSTAFKFTRGPEPFLHFLNSVYVYVDGKRSVKEIYEAFHEDDFFITIEDVVVAISYLSIIRLIKSKRKEHWSQNLYVFDSNKQQYLDFFDTKNNNPSILPTLVEIDITNKCNLNCIMCGYKEDGIRLQQDLLDTNTMKDILGQLSELKIPYVVFKGGEPTLRKDLFEIVRFCDEIGIVGGIITNGYDLNKELYDFIIKKDWKVHVSLDGSTSEIHNKIRCNSNSYTNAIKTISYLVERRDFYNKGYVIVNNIVQYINRNDMYDFTRLCKKLRVDQLDFSLNEKQVPLDYAKEIYESLKLLREDFNKNKFDDVKEYFGSLLSWFDAISRGIVSVESIQCGEMVRELFKENPANCYSFNTPCIDNQGNLFPCCMYYHLHKSKKDEFKLGNLLKTKFSEIVMSNNYIDFYKNYRCNRIDAICNMCENYFDFKKTDSDMESYNNNLISGKNGN